VTKPASYVFSSTVHPAHAHLRSIRFTRTGWSARNRGADMIEVLYQLGSRSVVCSRGVLSEHPGFRAHSNYTKSNAFTGCTCTKHVPFRYLFDEKPPVIVVRRRAGFRSRESSSRPLLAGKTRRNVAPESLPPEISPVLAAGAKGGKNVYLTPTKAP